VTAIDRSRLQRLLADERTAYAAAHPRSAAAYAGAQPNLLGGVPMTWMNMAAGGFPLYLARARGARVTDIDGREYVDFALGDTGAMAGHSPQPTVDAIVRRVQEEGGITAMMPTFDAAWVGAELARRFGPPVWSFTLTATDANRWAIRLARQVTGRPKILVNAYCYHGSVDETFAILDGNGRVVPRPGNVGAPVDVAETTRVVEFNDVEGLERALAHEDVAVVLMEPALTNIGIVLPEDGYLQEVRRLTRKHGTLLIDDETHTFSAGPGGATRAWGLEPDIVTIGKSIAGGIPIGAYGISQELADAITGDEQADIEDVGGVGGTLAGNALSLAAARATLEFVLTEGAFEGMIDRATRLAEGQRRVIEDVGLPWSVSQLGARAEYRYASPRNGSESNAAADVELDDYLHAHLANRGVLITPFHNMALMCPETSDGDVDGLLEAFSEAVAAVSR
jgi:glutamate-1-semialdehyde 2,1-aminomutase